VRRSRQALTALLIAGSASAACLVLILILAGRDEAPVAPAGGPGALQRTVRPGDPPTSGTHRTVRVTRDGRPLSRDAILTELAAGNVILFYDAARPPARLRALQRDVAGPFDPEVAAAGQAVVLARRPGTPGVIAAAWRRLLRASSPRDPRLREFVDAWLGQGARG
jgi:Protein of unknown function (DUF3105)